MADIGSVYRWHVLLQRYRLVRRSVRPVVTAVHSNVQNALLERKPNSPRTDRSYGSTLGLVDIQQLVQSQYGRQPVTGVGPVRYMTISVQTENHFGTLVHLWAHNFCVQCFANRDLFLTQVDKSMHECPPIHRRCTVAA